MWNPTTRRQHSREGLRYETDLTDAEWALIEGFFGAPARCGRPRAWPLREIVNAIFYVMRGGIARGGSCRAIFRPGGRCIAGLRRGGTRACSSGSIMRWSSSIETRGPCAQSIRGDHRQSKREDHRERRAARL